MLYTGEPYPSQPSRPPLKCDANKYYKMRFALTIEFKRSGRGRRRQKTFSTTTNYFGVTETVALKPNGENINVTMENRDEYGHLLIKYYLLDRVKSQLSAMLNGFYMVIPEIYISVFDFQELELLCCGLTHVDIDDWRRNTNYQHEYAALGERHPVIVWFWECVMEFDDATRCRLLQFVTGTARVPVGGLAALQGHDGVKIVVAYYHFEKLN